MTEEHKEHHGEHHHKEKKSDSITIEKATVWQIISGILGVLLVVSIFTGGFSGNKSDETAPEEIKEAQTAQPRQETPTPSPSQQIETGINVDGLNFKGTEDAKVTIIEYSSFSCGYCNRVRPTLNQILEAYPNDVKIIYKHFNRGGTDSKTAQATECAGEQGKFWEMHDTIFDKGSSGDLKGYAEDIGLNVPSFTECLDSGKYASRVEQDTSEARSNGITGTPGFIINGQLVSGAQPFENFKQVIEAELAK